ILELPFALERLLRNVGVGAERGVREGDERSANSAVDDVVPELIAEGKLVHGVARKNRVHGEVGNLKMVAGEVAVGEVAGAVGLIVQAVIDLGAVAEIGRVAAVDVPVEAAVVAPLIEGARNDGSGLRSETPVFREGKLGEGLGRFLETLAFAFAFE